MNHSTFNSTYYRTC